MTRGDRPTSYIRPTAVRARRAAKAWQDVKRAVQGARDRRAAGDLEAARGYLRLARQHTRDLREILRGER